jgi:WD40 repeat protein
VAVSPDGQRVVSASADNVLRLWDVPSGRQLGAPMTGHTEMVTSVAFSPDGHRILSNSDDNTIRLWDADTARPLGEPTSSLKSTVATITFTPDGQHVVSKTWDATRQLWPAPVPQEWPSMVCEKLITNVSQDTWNRWLPGVPYRQVCPGLPAG